MSERSQHDRDSAELRRLCAERDALAAELSALRKWEALVRENSPLVVRMESAEKELAALKAGAGEPVAWITADGLHLIFEGVLDRSQLNGCSPLYRRQPTMRDAGVLVSALERLAKDETYSGDIARSALAKFAQQVKA